MVYLSSAVVTLDAISIDWTGTVFAPCSALTSVILKLVGSLETESQVMVCGTERSISGVPLVSVMLGKVIVIAGGLLDVCNLVSQ
jgi:hypothetical protein